MQNVLTEELNLSQYFRTFVFGLADNPDEVRQKLNYLCFEPELDCIIFCNDVLGLDRTNTNFGHLVVNTPDGIFSVPRLDAINKAQQHVVISPVDELSSECGCEILVCASKSPQSSQPFTNKYLIGSALNKHQSAADVAVLEINFWNHF